ncbi:MAG: hypothetical protein AUK44_00865 [Porphyromonadaceae bacterium CG2_30_38_12]|nr:MAG: hypothetical protein AUK44_00865 [Porphyromonadaceae bacterium CG2_30_38_12]
MLLLILITNIMSQTIYKTAQEAKGLQVGDIVRDFSALDLHDTKFQLSTVLKKGPVVLIFYRGQWCPICNKHLQSLQDSLSLIYEKGAAVVAVSAEKSEFLKRTAEKTHASFTLLYDDGYKISNQFDVTFRPDRMSRLMYNGMLGANLKEAQTDDSQQLPIPATFIINKDSKIVWRHFDPDYKKRSTVKDILVNIPNPISFF